MLEMYPEAKYLQPHCYDSSRPSASCSGSPARATAFGLSRSPIADAASRAGREPLPAASSSTGVDDSFLAKMESLQVEFDQTLQKRQSKSMNLRADQQLSPSSGTLQCESRDFEIKDRKNHTCGHIGIGESDDDLTMHRLLTRMDAMQRRIEAEHLHSEWMNSVNECLQHENRELRDAVFVDGSWERGGVDSAQQFTSWEEAAARALAMTPMGRRALATVISKPRRASSPDVGSRKKTSDAYQDSCSENVFRRGTLRRYACRVSAAAAEPHSILNCALRSRLTGLRPART